MKVNYLELKRKAEYVTAVCVKIAEEPLLDYVRFYSIGKGFIMNSQNHHVRMLSPIMAEVEKPFDMAVLSSDLLKLIGSFPIAEKEANVEISFTATGLTLQYGDIKNSIVGVGSYATTSLQNLTEKYDEIEFDKVQIKDLQNATKFSSTGQNIMNSVCLKDGFIVAGSKVSLIKFSNGLKTPRTYVIKTEIVRVLKGVTVVKMKINPHYTQIQTPDFIVEANTLKPEFPPYDNLFDLSGKIEMTFNTENLINALNVVSFAVDEDNRVIFTIKDGIAVLETVNNNCTRASKTLVSVTANADVKFAFNSAILLKALSNCGEEVKIICDNTNAQYVINNSRNSIVMQPIRLTKVVQVTDTAETTADDTTTAPPTDEIKTDDTTTAETTATETTTADKTKEKKSKEKVK